VSIHGNLYQNLIGNGVHHCICHLNTSEGEEKVPFNTLLDLLPPQGFMFLGHAKFLYGITNINCPFGRGLYKGDVAQK
jgi:hypothetical protein